MARIMPATLASKAATTAFAIWPTYSANRNIGNSTTVSATKAAVAGFFEYAMPVPYYMFEMAPLAFSGLQAAHKFRQNKYNEIQSHKEDRSKGFIGGNYTDTKHAQAMRLAAVQQMQSNKLNTRSALGGEARLISTRKKGI